MKFDPKCAEYEAEIIAAPTWNETRRLMAEYHAWFRERYVWDDVKEVWFDKVYSVVVQRQDK